MNRNILIRLAAGTNYIKLVELNFRHTKTKLTYNLQRVQARDQTIY